MNKNRRIVIYSMGTLGDVLPMVHIGKYFQDQDYRVDFLTCEYFAGVVEQAGFKFVKEASSALYEKVFSNPKTWTAEGLKDHYQEFHFHAAETSFLYLKQMVVSGEQIFVVLQDELSGAMMACREFNIPYAQLVLAPSSIHSSVDPHFPLSVMISEKDRAAVMPKIVGKLEEYRENSIVKPLINPLRRSLGLRPWGFEDIPKLSDSKNIIACFPSWIKIQPKDWPTQLFFGGFPVGKADDVETAPEVVSFLDSFQKEPFVFTFGTGHKPRAKLVADAFEVSRAFDRPCIFVTRYAKDLEQEIDIKSGALLLIEQVDFNYLFRRSGLVVHHGGIGTSASALAAGVPQLIMPITFDQPDNAHCLWKLGVANAIDYSEYKIEEMASAIDYLLMDEDVATKLQVYRQKLSEVSSSAYIGEYIESLF